MNANLGLDEQEWPPGTVRIEGMFLKFRESLKCLAKGTNKSQHRSLERRGTHSSTSTEYRSQWSTCMLQSTSSFSMPPSMILNIVPRVGLHGANTWTLDLPVSMSWLLLLRKWTNWLVFLEIYCTELTRTRSIGVVTTTWGVMNRKLGFSFDSKFSTDHYSLA